MQSKILARLHTQVNAETQAGANSPQATQIHILLKMFQFRVK